VPNFLFRFEVAAGPLLDPGLVLNTLPDDSTPEFTFVDEIADGDTIRLQITAASDPGFAAPQSFTNTVGAAAVDVTMVTGPLSDGDYLSRVRRERAGVPRPWTNVIAHQITSFHVDELAWRNAVIAAGSPVSATQTANISNLITALDVGGVWPFLDRLTLFAGEVSAQQSLIDVRNPSLVSVINNTPAAFNAYGYTGNPASGFWINSKFFTNATGDNFGPANMSMGAYVSTVSVGGQIMGEFTGYQFALFMNHQFVVGALSHNAAVLEGAPNSVTPGFYAVTLDATQVTLWKNGGIVGQQPTPNSGVNTFPVGIFGRVAGGTPDAPTIDLPTDARIGAFFFGGNLDATKLGTLHAALQTYMAAWGAAD